MRKAIWNKFSDDLQQDVIEIDASKEDAKKIRYIIRKIKIIQGIQEKN